MSAYKPGYYTFINSVYGEFIECYRGTSSECLAFCAGANISTPNNYYIVISAEHKCICGESRILVKIESDGLFEAREGCALCNVWDAPIKLINGQ